MKTNQSESSSDVWRWFQNQADSLGPAVLGSLSLRRSPCVRENCPACLWVNSMPVSGRLRSPERSTVCCLCSRRTCAGGTSLFGKRACSAGPALPGRTALCQSFETGAGQSLEKSGGLKMPRSTKPQISFADWELLQQGSCWSRCCRTSPFS